MSARAARVVAQAKINLRLRILARETSGYHQLETLFARLELGDVVVVRGGVSGRSLDVRGADTGPVEQNLAWRAAMALREAGGPDGFAIEIDKHVPIGGGLGGGSADAGAVLRALNALSSRPLPPTRLLELASALGADVPFLTSESAFALAWGRGERMLALPPPTAAPVLLAVPDFRVSTSDAYAWLDDDRRSPATSGPVQLDPTALATWEGLAPHCVNDFEAVVEPRHPAIGALRGVFRSAGARVALMSGSGSTVFGLFDREGDATAVRESMVAEHGARLVRTAIARSVAPVQLEVR